MFDIAQYLPDGSILLLTWLTIAYLTQEEKPKDNGYDTEAEAALMVSQGIRKRLITMQGLLKNPSNLMINGLIAVKVELYHIDEQPSSSQNVDDALNKINSIVGYQL